MQPYTPNEILTSADRDALKVVREQSRRSRRVLYQVKPLAFVALFVTYLAVTSSVSKTTLVMAGFAVVLTWNTYRQRLDELAVAIDGLYKIAENSERLRNSPL